MKGLGQTSYDPAAQHVEGIPSEESFGLPVRPRLRVAIEAEQVVEGDISRQTDVYDRAVAPESPHVLVVRAVGLPPALTPVINLALVHAAQMEKIIVLTNPSIRRSVDIQVRHQVSHEHLAEFAGVLVPGFAELGQLLDD